MALRPCENSCQRDGGCFWVCLTLFWPVMLVLAGTFAYLGVTFLKNRALLAELWKLLDAADIVCAHNGDRFDLRFSNSRLLVHGFGPYSNKSIDTLKIARKHFKFGSNKLDDLGNYLGVGRKLFTLSRDTLLGAVAGNRRCWADLKKYNAQDVLLLERVCLKLRPWATTHPNLSHHTQAPRARCVGQRLAVPSRICQDRFHFE